MIDEVGSAMDERVDGDARRKADDRERKLQNDAYEKNGKDCLALFSNWKEERDRLGEAANNSGADASLQLWIMGKVYRKVENEFLRSSQEQDAISDSLRKSWEDIASDIMDETVDKLRNGDIRTCHDLLGYIGKAHLITRGKLRDEADYYKSKYNPYEGICIQEDDGEKEWESAPFDFNNLPVESLSVWTLCGELIPWLIPADQEFLLVQRLVGLGDKKTALRLTGLTDEAFKGRNKRIVQRCRVALKMLEEFRLPGEYLSHTKERVEGLVQSLGQTDSQLHPKSFAEAVQMAQQTHPVRLQDALHTEDTRHVRKLLLTLYRRPKPV